MTSRRALVATGLVAAAGLAGCSTLTAPVSRATSATSDEPTIMLIRHAEKPDGSGAPFGVLPSGQTDPESLTTTGWGRAGALVTLFDPVGTAGPLPLRAGLARPARLVAADPDRDSRRPFQTLGPLGARLGVEVATPFAKGQEAALAESLRRATRPVLVAWEHEAIPAIVAGLGAIEPEPPRSWPGDRFDLVWCFTASGASAWRFAQLPQLLLAGDGPAPA